MSPTCNDSMEKTQRLNIENGDSFPHPGLLKYKRRKVSVVRDFPLGCGRNFMQNNSTPVTGVIGDIFESSLSVQHEVLGSMQMSNANIALETTKQTNISCLEDVHNTVNGESSLLNKDLEANDELFKNIRSVVGDEPLKDLHGVVVSDIREEVLEHSKLRPSSPPVYPSFVSIGKDVKTVVVRKYPPRRKVSAIRDFPPFCGQNAPPLSQEKGSLLIVSQNNFGHQYKASNLDKNVECAIDNTHKEKHNIELVENVTKLTMDKICTGLMVEPIEATKMDDKCGSEKKYTSEKRTNTSRSDQVKFDNKCTSTLNKVTETMEDKLEKEIVVYIGEALLKENILDMPSHQKQLELVPCEQTLAVEKPVVLGLMASSICPWRQGKSNLKPPSEGGSSGIKVKKCDSKQLEKSKSVLRKEDGKKYHKRSSTKTYVVEKDVNVDMHQLVIAGSMDKNINDDEIIDSHVNYRFNNSDVSLIPFSQTNESGNEQGSDSKGTRTRVRETLRLFQAVCRKLLQEEEARKKVQGSAPKRIDFIAAKILKDKGKYVNVGKQILGPVLGVEVGDEFRYRIELNIIGLHRQTQSGIDYVKHGKKILATSIVASGGYVNNLDNSDVLIYIGQGGNMLHSDKEPEDQKLERGNLALKNSFDEKSPVRVIRGSESSDGRTYVYDGLYLVEKWWQDLGPHGKLIFKFQLCRIPGQPELAWKELKRSKKFKVREGLCVDDISEGKESTPICAVNIIDDEKPPPFNYITKMIYPDWCRPLPLKGCVCIDGCSDSETCYCAVLNGGEIPFNHNGAIVEAKALVYECGPSCKCPPSCHNRVSQHGIKFQLEVFKTKSRGWGVRSLNSIPSGSFICEYIGELLEDKEADQRTGNDEYLFDIGNNSGDNSLWDGLSTLLPDVHADACNIVEDGGFTIDAASYGNIGRFINHSCSPNLYAQNVLYDHEDKRIPHIMFFAAENIPPLQELSYHYNYMMDQVRDSDGNIKKKRCHCGSAECTGRMY